MISNMLNGFQIVFPVYNEEKRMRNSIIKTVSFLEANHYKNFSILIADNLSTDKTADIAKELSGIFRQVSYLRINQKGVGIALKTAWGKSEYDIIGYMDIDLSASLIHLEEAFNILTNDEADIVIGSRLKPGSKVKNRTLIREVASRAYNFLLRRYLGVKFSDAVCGFKFLRREIFNKIKPEGIESNEWFFDTELLVKAEWNNLKIAEIPVHWVDDMDTRVDLLDTAIKYLKGVRRLKKIKNEFKN